MLKSLLIKNYALIRHLEMEPSGALNIITGETGAGKSIMLGAIGLLLGHRADTKVLFDQNEKCVIEGTFDISGYEMKTLFEEEDIDYDKLCIIRREISPGSKSRAFINDTPVNLDSLKKWGARLMDIHSQHETLLLGNSNFQISVLDAFAGNREKLKEYQIQYKAYKSLEESYRGKLSASEEAKKQLDYHHFLLQELKEASLQEGEQDKQEEELKLLENGEEIKVKLNSMVTMLTESESALVPNLQSMVKTLDQLSVFSKNYEKLRARAYSCLAELKDLSEELEREEASIEADQNIIEKIRERLSLLYSLQKKHHVQTVEDLLAIEQDLEGKVNQVLDMDEEIDKLKAGLDKMHQEILEKAEALSKSRGKVCDKLKDELEALLKEVGMPGASIKIAQEKTELSVNGTDKISILFSASKGVAPEELKNAASGGEFSRLMLCIKYILASKTELPTMIFDEIDSGISGEIAFKVGKMMKQMADSHQVIAITHQPQIAAQGEAHYYVYKDDTSERAVSRIRRLTEEERVKEIAQMIGGAKPSETAVKNARELLENC